MSYPSGVGCRMYVLQCSSFFFSRRVFAFETRCILSAGKDIQQQQ